MPRKSAKTGEDYSTFPKGTGQRNRRIRGYTPTFLDAAAGWKARTAPGPGGDALEPLERMDCFGFYRGRSAYHVLLVLEY